MPADLHDFLTHDHERLDAILDAAVRPDGTIDLDRWNEFRRGLLRHIGMEERVLFPELRRRGRFSEAHRQLHRDHALLGALLVPPPTKAEIDLVRATLTQHNPLEEEAGGLYDLAETLVGDELAGLMERVHAIPEIPLAKFSDTPTLRWSIEQLIREAEEGRERLNADREAGRRGDD